MAGCLSCGAQNAEDVLYCFKCGKRLEPPTPPPEYWRDSGSLGQQTAQGSREQAYQPPPAYQNNAAYAPPQVQPTRQPPAQYAPAYPAPVSVAPAGATSPLSQVGMTLSIVVACVVLLGLIPCLGWLNWFALIFGKITLILCIVAVATEKDPNRRSMAVIGLVITSVALGVAIIRLIISLVFGAGCL